MNENALSAVVTGIVTAFATFLFLQRQSRREMLVVDTVPVTTPDVVADPDTETVRTDATTDDAPPVS